MQRLYRFTIHSQDEVYKTLHVAFGEYYGARQRLLKYVYEPGLPIGITEEEAEISAEVVEKQLP